MAVLNRLEYTLDLPEYPRLPISPAPQLSDMAFLPDKQIAPVKLQL